MKERILPLLACPQCGGGLECAGTARQGDEIRTGRLDCRACRRAFPITDYIPRFVSDDNYAANFGLEWKRHARTQIDRFNGTTISADRFFRETRWPRQLPGCRILEVGCGAGRFTQVAAATGADIFTFDYSGAVDANRDNNGLQPNLHYFQADVYRMPFKQGLFDYVFCMGVIQHTPHPAATFDCLVRQVRPGGRLAIDVYKNTRRTRLQFKYFARGLTKRLDARRLYQAVSWLVPRLLPIKRRLQRVPIVGRKLHRVLPIAYYFDEFPQLTRTQQVDWSILDTFDQLSPRYDQPQKLQTLQRWLRRPDLSEIELDSTPGAYVFVARARRKPDVPV